MCGLVWCVYAGMEMNWEWCSSNPLLTPSLLIEIGDGLREITSACGGGTKETDHKQGSIDTRVTLLSALIRCGGHFRSKSCETNKDFHRRSLRGSQPVGNSCGDFKQILKG